MLACVWVNGTLFETATCAHVLLFLPSDTRNGTWEDWNPPRGQEHLGATCSPVSQTCQGPSGSGAAGGGAAQLLALLLELAIQEGRGHHSGGLIPGHVFVVVNSLSLCMWVFVFICEFVCMRLRVCVCIHVCLCINLCLCVFLIERESACMYVYVCLCVCLCVCMNIYIYICV